VSLRNAPALSITTDLEPVELGGSAQLTVYRLVQESLTNIGKYAEAKQAEISLHNFDSYITVEVKDNGKGFKLGSVGPGAMAWPACGIAWKPPADG
jgi:signal transduction histidine kinase